MTNAATARDVDRDRSVWRALAGASDNLEFSVINDQSSISSAASRIDAFRAAHGLAAGISFDFSLAIDELVTNTVGYGYDDGGDRWIDLCLRLEGHTLTMVIADDGKAFDPLRAPEPDLSAQVEECARGGLGIHLVRKTMNGVAYRRENGRNVVTLTKSTVAGETG